MLITLDTTRADHLSVYGYERPTTPFLQEMAPRLLQFDNAYSQITNTRSSHFSLFTSRYPKDIGIWNNDEGDLPARELTVTEVLRSAGWSTGAVVSVSFMPRESGLGQAFDEYHVPRSSAVKQIGEQTTGVALDFIDRRAHEPFFLWIHYFDAHLPYQPPPAYRGLFWSGPPPRDADVDRALIPKWMADLFVVPNRAYMTAMYDGSLRYLDDQLRAIFDHLRAVGVLDKTIVVIAADHGESLGEHGLHFIHNSVFEPTVHVPLLVFLPGKSGVRSTAVVENLDIAPTILDAVGLAKPSSFTGTSLLAPDEARSEERRDTAFFEQSARFATGFRRGAHKFIDSRMLKSRTDLAGTELREWFRTPDLAAFDLARDPGETTNVLDRDPEQTDRDRTFLRAWLGAAAAGIEPRPYVGSTPAPSSAASGGAVVVSGAPSPTPSNAMDPAVSERLRALGYVR